MRRLVMALLAIALLSFSSTAFASSWGMVGKVLTGIEGARILTGGKFDVIGNVMDIAKIRHDRNETVYEKRVYVVESPVARERVWVPAHTEYDPRLGKIFVEGHYVIYQVEDGGYCAYKSHNKAHDRYSRGGRR